MKMNTRKAHVVHHVLNLRLSFGDLEVQFSIELFIFVLNTLSFLTVLNCIKILELSDSTLIKSFDLND